MSVSVIGVDLGGTKVAVVPKRGQELGESHVQPTKCSSGPELIDQLVQIVTTFRGEELDAVGIGVPSIVEFQTGQVVSSVNVPLAEVPLRQVLGERLGVPVFVDNDATVAALAEAHDDELRLVAHNLVMLTVGTGVGGGLVLGGRIYRGASGGAGELGHMIVGLDLRGDVPAPTRFPQPGSLEWEASGHTLDRLAAESADDHPKSALGRLRAAGKQVLGPDVVRAAEDGDAAASRIVESWGQRLGVGVANVINIFDPEEVVIGGGAAQAGELLLGPTREAALGYVLPGLGRCTTIRLARHGIRAGVLGAALLAEHELQTFPQRPTGRAPAGRTTTEVPS